MSSCPAEDQAHIVPFLQRIKHAYGIPLALVHDMGKGILSAVATVFPDVPDFICHFHVLRDIGKDFMGAEYDVIRKRLRMHPHAACSKRSSPKPRWFETSTIQLT